MERKIVCYFSVGKHEKGIFLNVYGTGRKDLFRQPLDNFVKHHSFFLIKSVPYELLCLNEYDFDFASYDKCSNYHI